MKQNWIAAVIVALCMGTGVKALDLEFGLYEIKGPQTLPDVRGFVVLVQPTLESPGWSVGDRMEWNWNADASGIEELEFKLRGGVPQNTIDVMLPPEAWDPAFWPNYSWIATANSPPNIYPPLPGGYDQDIHVEEANDERISVRWSSENTEESEDDDNDPVTPVDWVRVCGAVMRASGDAAYRAKQMYQQNNYSKSYSTDPNDYPKIVPVATTGVSGSYYELQFYYDRSNGDFWFEQVPEPASLSLMLLGGLMLVRRRR